MTYLHIIISLFRTSEYANEKLTVKSRYHKFVVDGRVDGVFLLFMIDVRFSSWLSTCWGILFTKINKTMINKQM